ncbi:hypothetical protein Tco_0300171 [Tanacetum coccineum]
MWSSTMTIAPTSSSAIIQLPISDNFRIKDDPTEGILDAGGIFLYNTPNEAFKILEDKVLLKLDFSDDSQNPKPKTIISVGRSNIDPDDVILVDKFEALATKIDSECLIIRKELKEMQDDRRDNHASQIYISDDTPMCDPMEANYDCAVHIPYTNAKTFPDDVLLNHVGDKELKLIDGVGIGRITNKEKEDNGVPKEPNKELKLNDKVQVMEEDD